ncbi:MAG: dTDP-4-dehydrorhamnose 3,5-epimerase [Pelistega sp.]|nr:dTDP-4-dehydrorhamnose 3,5-epimerase [Pelistega sp.]
MSIHGVYLLDDTVYRDERGYFIESYQQARLQELLGREIDFVQDNLSMSQQGVLRGLHYQYQHPQAKLVRVLQGEILDVVVDLRQSSPSFGQWAGYRLAAPQIQQGTLRAQQLFIPEGCAHGFLTLSTSALVMYKVTDFYHPEDEYCLRYDDPTLAIQWPLPQASISQASISQASIPQPPIISAKDAQGLAWQDLPLFT